MVRFLPLFLFLVVSCHPDGNIREGRLATTQSRMCSTLEQVVDSWLGVPYLYGGENRDGLDCSSFTQHIFKETFHLDIPRTTRGQFAMGQTVRGGFLRCGDIVFFKNVRGRGVDHTGVYLGHNHFAHASTTRGVVISDLSTSYYKQRFVGARRYTP